MNRRNVIDLKHFTSVTQLEAEDVFSLIRRAIAYKKGETYRFLEPKFATLLMFEKSTSMQYATEMALNKLGIQTVYFDLKNSDMSKGESLYDTVLTLSELGADVLIIEKDEAEYYRDLVEKDSLECAILNIGDGIQKGDYPVQSMTDLMTIYQQFGRFENLKIGIVGDIQHSRVAKSNMRILKKLGAQLYFAGPNEWAYYECQLYGNWMSVDDLVEQVDVIMMVRTKKEKHVTAFDSQHFFQTYGLTIERAKRLKKDAIIMHPGPINRNVEIADELVESPQSRIRIQRQNNVFMTMAVLEALLT